jgi:hypothetical protein
MEKGDMNDKLFDAMALSPSGLRLSEIGKILNVPLSDAEDVMEKLENEGKVINVDGHWDDGLWLLRRAGHTIGKANPLQYRIEECLLSFGPRAEGLIAAMLFGNEVSTALNAMKSEGKVIRLPDLRWDLASQASSPTGFEIEDECDAND